MAASPQVTVRLDPELYMVLVKMAELEHKTIADVTRELIQIGLGKKGSARDGFHMPSWKYEKSRKPEATEKWN